MCKMLELTLTCFACGIPSSSLWARRVRRRRPGSGTNHQSHNNGHHNHHSPSAPFYSQLEGKDCPPGAVVNEDGTVNLCAFCFALLDSASRGNVEGARVAGITPESNHRASSTIWKFVCGVCAVETYRKRVRALPLQKFQFLSKTRKPGSISITLGDSECAVVCLDCSETLWIQSDEYDRWGLPEHKRHFNWMARPPPPEDSEEANLARLPSGKSQLPRTPHSETLSAVNVSKTNEMNGELELQILIQPNLRHHKKISRPLRSSSSASSNSNSSNSNLPLDFETLHGSSNPQQPMAKRQRLTQNGSPPSWLNMDQSLPHMESLDLSTRQSPSSSQQSLSDHNGQSFVTPALIQSMSPFQEYPPSLIPLSRMSFLTYSTPSPCTSTSTSGTEYEQRNKSPASQSHSPTSGCTSFTSESRSGTGGHGRQRSTPIPILSAYHGHDQSHIVSNNYNMGQELFRPTNPEIRPRYVPDNHSHPLLHQPHFVYTARPPPTMREKDLTYFRPFLSRIPTRIGGHKLQTPSQTRLPSIRLPKDEQSQPRNPCLNSSQSYSRSKTEIISSSSKFRRCSVPETLKVGSAPGQRSRVAEETNQIAILPKKRRSWDHLNRVVEGIDEASILKYAPHQMSETTYKLNSEEIGVKIN